MPENISNNQAKKPEGMSERAWINLHKVLAKIHVNHFSEIQELQKERERKKEAI
ncbi:hypothetical protein [Paenibacillus sp. 79R4]|uniref:hypothetical protein n=1 Tax=Paenibacillus sp. 79R4 TaxID=2212847 RepID=UPI0015B8BB44|nr:hypothetical protein [Paenibacillus sp. 79R4]